MLWPFFPRFPCSFWQSDFLIALIQTQGDRWMYKFWHILVQILITVSHCFLSLASFLAFNWAELSSNPIGSKFILHTLNYTSRVFLSRVWLRISTATDLLLKMIVAQTLIITYHITLRALCQSAAFFLSEMRWSVIKWSNDLPLYETYCQVGTGGDLSVGFIPQQPLQAQQSVLVSYNHPCPAPPPPLNANWTNTNTAPFHIHCICCSHSESHKHQLLTEKTSSHLCWSHK